MYISPCALQIKTLKSKYYCLGPVRTLEIGLQRFECMFDQMQEQPCVYLRSDFVL